MTKLNLSTLLAASLLLAGCSAKTGWVPTVDTYNKPNAYLVNQDLAECEQLALKTSGDASKQKLQADDLFRRAYKSCLRQRRHTVIN